MLSLEKFVGPGILDDQSRPLGLNVPCTNYALASMASLAVSSRLAGGPGPDPPEEPKVRLARVVYSQDEPRTWRGGINPLLRGNTALPK
ncbi:Ank3 [Symbiodinium microadriaticum]|nr:Ank3 [Symbiodinium microadriaticum]